ncbi:ComEA family DNA-binding protein [Thalassotalea mangrovi]|uniref:Helix-hairpin-helix domain-containing protein n=1 Tax=Thalassotalea mangrovi TaxID=2572245 RepID=A0A4U1B6U4_9GAMM|nr:helix-hairpin-helix domain-containing protein [Thalassotalea mangrovi]TKB45907.1 helix-hairpin-helix domain-containing protein [Thalassotalea mangrovi]
MKKLLFAVVLSFIASVGISNYVYAAETVTTESEVMATVDLNKADVSQLQAIKGLGAKKAQAIIDYREANGPFTDVKQLLNVKGIGEKFLMKNAKLLRI